MLPIMVSGGNKKHSPCSFTEQLVLSQCLVCNCNIGGGTRNFDKHETSKPHLDNIAKAAREKPYQPIMSFFSHPKPTPPTLHMGPQLIMIASTPFIVIDDSDKPVKNPPIPFKSHPLIMHLRALTASLPTSVPVGTDNNKFTCFAVDLASMVQPGNDPWKDIINPTYD